MRSFERILDFGCGCGRTLLFMRDLTPATSLHGSDIDAEAIRWCRRHLGFATFSENPARPPTRHGDGAFDLAYAISVFTHIPEDMQFAWLEELRRVVEPGGIVVVTLHGAATFETLPPDAVPQLERDGFVFWVNDFWRPIFPSWYQTSYHTKGYIQREFARYFDVVEHIEAGLNDKQDVVVMRRP